MSYTRLLSLFLICFSLMLGSCSKEDSTSPNDTNNSNNNTNSKQSSFTAKVNGVSWSPANLVATHMLNSIHIMGTNSFGGVVNQLFLSLSKDVKPGTYNMEFRTDGNYSLSYTEGVGSTGEMWMIGLSGKTSGTVVVTKATADELEGTFTATLESMMNDKSPKKEITEGKFYINFKK